MAKFRISEGDVHDALKTYIACCDAEELAALFEHAFACVKNASSDVPKDGDEEDGYVVFEGAEGIKVDFHGVKEVGGET